ncbi:unnamed protein product, partial [Vitis vinifera]
MRYRPYHLLRKELSQLKGLFQRSRTKRDHGFYMQRKPRFRLKSKTSPDEGQSLPKTLIYISCGWESFKEDCKSPFRKEWHLDKAHGFNFLPGTQSEVLTVFKRGPGAGLKKKKSGKRKKKPLRTIIVMGRKRRLFVSSMNMTERKQSSSLNQPSGRLHHEMHKALGQFLCRSTMQYQECMGILSPNSRNWARKEIAI